MRKKFRKKELENTLHVFVHIIPRHIEKKNNATNTNTNKLVFFCLIDCKLDSGAQLATSLLLEIL